MDSSTTSSAPVDSAPASAPSPAPSAPAESRPTTVDAALEQSFAASLRADETPAAETPAPTVTEGTAPATAEPPPAAPPAAPTDKQGPIPFETHTRILANTRQKERDAVLAEVQQQYGPQLQIVQRLQNDFVGTLAQLWEEGEAHPQFGPLLSSLAARKLAALRQPKADPKPEPDLQAGDGTLVYSADRAQQLLAWEKREVQREMQEHFAQQLAPLQQFQQEQQQRAQREQQQQVLSTLQQQAREQASQTLAQYRTDPDFKTHENEIKALMQEQGYTLDRAWLTVYRDVVEPKKRAGATNAWVQQAFKKSQGSTPDPAASAPVQRPRARTVDEALDQVFAPLAAG